MSIFISEPGRPNGIRSTQTTQTRKTGAVTGISASTAANSSPNDSTRHSPANQRIVQGYDLSNESQESLQKPYLPVARLSSTAIASIPATATLADALASMGKLSTRQLVVTIENEIAGILEREDALEAAHKYGSDSIALENIELPAFITATPETDAHQLARLMLAQELNSALIVTADGQPRGVITTTDYLRLYANLSLKDERA